MIFSGSRIDVEVYPPNGRSRYVFVALCESADRDKVGRMVTPSIENLKINIAFLRIEGYEILFKKRNWDDIEEKEFWSICENLQN